MSDNIFSIWDDVKREYEMDEPQPDQILHMWYNYEDYCGSSVVIYRNGDKFYRVFEGHCSCHGLEGQWEPEEYDLDTFVAVLEKEIESNIHSYSYNRYHKKVMNKIEKYKRKLTKNGK